MIYDLLGAIFSVCATWLFIKKDSRAWLVSFFAIGLNCWLYFQKSIYADACLEGCYLISSCYGWYRWSNTSESLYSQNQIIKTLSLKQWMCLIPTTCMLYILIFYFLTHLTDSSIPKLDAFTTVLSLTAQLFMCYKIITTWIIWFIADALYAVMYWQKNLPFHVALMVAYVFMAVVGYYSWMKLKE